MIVPRGGDFVFAQPRLQARHATLLGADQWAEVELITDFGQFLQSVRATPLAPAVESIGTASDLDEIESGVHDALADRAAETAFWVPDDWQPAVLHVQPLLRMPFRRPLRAGLGVRRMAREPEPRGAGRAKKDTPETIAPDTAPVGESWFTEWQALWPRSIEGLADIGRRLVAAALPDLDGDTPWPERRRLLAHRLTRAFRRHAFGPGAVFAQLGLVCLEFGRLRGNLSARRAGLIK